jgi:hypothetical protein
MNEKEGTERAGLRSFPPIYYNDEIDKIFTSI